MARCVCVAPLPCLCCADASRPKIRFPEHPAPPVPGDRIVRRPSHRCLRVFERSSDVFLLAAMRKSGNERLRLARFALHCAFEFQGLEVAAASAPPQAVPPFGTQAKLKMCYHYVSNTHHTPASRLLNKRRCGCQRDAPQPLLPACLLATEHVGAACHSLDLPNGLSFLMLSSSRSKYSVAFCSSHASASVATACGHGAGVLFAFSTSDSAGAAAGRPRRA